jgi:peptidoglycan/xylan/chitin deacetylase (PgdA/CDA1 family)
MIRQQLGKVKRYLSNSFDNGAIVLLYHRVILLPKDPQLLSVEPDYFYDQVALLKKNFQLLTIADFYEILYKKQSFPKRSVIITFDDGYADNFKNALPVLESLNVQALFYISTAKLGTPYEMWWDELERIFLSNNSIPGYLEMLIANASYRFELKNENDRFKAYNELHVLLKYIPVNERDQIINKLQVWAGIETAGRKDYLMMTGDELFQLSQSPSAIIGAHTHNHPALSILDYENQIEEMATSKTKLERILQKEVVHFSYPYGSRKDFNLSGIRAAKATGFKMACANYYGQVHRWTNRYAIPRILVRNWKLNEFSKHVKTFVQY